MDGGSGSETAEVVGGAVEDATAGGVCEGALLLLEGPVVAGGKAEVAGGKAPGFGCQDGGSSCREVLIAGALPSAVEASAEGSATVAGLHGDKPVHVGLGDSALHGEKGDQAVKGGSGLDGKMAMSASALPASKPRLGVRRGVPPVLDLGGVPGSSAVTSPVPAGREVTEGGAPISAADVKGTASLLPGILGSQGSSSSKGREGAGGGGMGGGSGGVLLGEGSSLLEGVVSQGIGTAELDGGHVGGQSEHGDLVGRGCLADLGAKEPVERVRSRSNSPQSRSFSWKKAARGKLDHADVVTRLMGALEGSGGSPVASSSAMADSEDPVVGGDR